MPRAVNISACVILLVSIVSSDPQVKIHITGPVQVIFGSPVPTFEQCSGEDGFCVNNADHCKGTIITLYTSLEDHCICSKVPNQQDFYSAAKEGNLSAVNNAIATGINLNYRDQDNGNWTALHWASRYNYTEVVSALLSAGADKEVKNDDGNTPLYLASWYNNPAVVTVLLAAGADKNSENNLRLTPIFAASAQGSRDALSVLIEHGDDVNKLTYGRNTPMMIATKFGHVNIVDALITAQADITLREREEWTALHYAAEYNRLAIAELLLQAGADPRKLNEDYDTPSEQARLKGYDQLADFIDDFTSTTDG